MYYGEIRVQTSKKGQMIKALDFLEIDYHKPSANKPEIKKSACESMEGKILINFIFGNISNWISV